jgi:hypothetical protein
VTVGEQARFDPYLMLKALERQMVSYVVIGAFARVIHGTDELTRGLDITPSMREGNLERLEEALTALNGRRDDGGGLRLGFADMLEPVIAVRTDAGELKIVPEPEGTAGYDDLRYAATREPLGQGVRPSVASPGDLARMLAAMGREADLKRLRTLRRVIELEQQLGRGVELGL